LPVVGQGERVDVFGVSLSVAGLWAMWNILVKGTLGVATTAIMAATTPVPALLHGLEHLRLPKVFVGICAFMIRYLDVITGEMNRMRWRVRRAAPTPVGSGRRRPTSAGVVHPLLRTG
jgi:cobalt/nickel transport system permease protein